MINIIEIEFDYSIDRSGILKDLGDSGGFVDILASLLNRDGFIHIGDLLELKKILEYVENFSFGLYFQDYLSNLFGGGILGFAHHHNTHFIHQILL